MSKRTPLQRTVTGAEVIEGKGEREKEAVIFLFYGHYFAAGGETASPA
jgi:hypothetical protein